MRARLCGSVSGRYRTEENFLLTKHVVAAGTFAKDAGSTPAASTIKIRDPSHILDFSAQIPHTLCMKVPDPDEFPVSVKQGSCTVRIYRQINKGYVGFKVACYDKDGRRKVQTF